MLSYLQISPIIIMNREKVRCGMTLKKTAYSGLMKIPNTKHDEYEAIMKY